MATTGRIVVIAGRRLEPAAASGFGPVVPASAEGFTAIAVGRTALPDPVGRVMKPLRVPGLRVPAAANAAAAGLTVPAEVLSEAADGLMWPAAAVV